MISIKKFLDKQAPGTEVAEPELSELLEEAMASDLLSVTMESYRSTLRTIVTSATEACPGTAHNLEEGIAGVEGRLAVEATPEMVEQVRQRVEALLLQWGRLTADHLKGKADEVKELLVMLARTAESVGERDQRYAGQFGGLTAELRAIANLDDLTQVRSSLVKKATELKSRVDQMKQDGDDSLAQLKSKLTAYESKLKVVEQLASKDTLTGLANRRSVEARMESNIAMEETFCVVVIDLNLFKGVNDKYGHLAGDDLLKKFSQSLQKIVRGGDLVGRWGGDEFIIVLNRDLEVAKSQVERIRQWVFGDYAIETGTGALKIRVSASIGIAQWQPGETLQQVIEQADAAMYLEKQGNRSR